MTTSPTPAVEMNQSNVIFSGKVLNVTEEGVTKVTFDVDKIWKGWNEATITLTELAYRSPCGFDFDVGENWLVYANMSGENLGRKIISRGCGNTTLLKYAAADLAVLGAGKLAPPPPNPANKVLPIAFVLLNGIVIAWALRKRKR